MLQELNPHSTGQTAKQAETWHRIFWPYTYCTTQTHNLNIIVQLTCPHLYSFTTCPQAQASFSMVALKPLLQAEQGVLLNHHRACISLTAPHMDVCRRSRINPRAAQSATPAHVQCLQRQPEGQKAIEFISSPSRRLYIWKAGGTLNTVHSNGGLLISLLQKQPVPPSVSRVKL